MKLFVSRHETTCMVVSDKPGNTYAKEYVYNKNGAMVEDKNKGIIEIDYNVLNLPDRIAFEDGNTTHYLYDASGVKHRVTHGTSQSGAGTGLGVGGMGVSVLVPTDYCGPVIYEDGTLKRVLTPEGYLSPGGSGNQSFLHNYFVNDYLGNVRAVLTWNNGGKQTTNYTVTQRNDYYAWGLPTSTSLNPEAQPYKREGKELDEMHGLNTYDQGARQFGTHLPVTMVPDPMAEKYYSISPYAQWGNNPITRIDPDGMDWVVSKRQFEYDGNTYDYDHYEWMDDIVQDSELPNGYRYVGANNSDILDHMGVSERYETKSDVSSSLGLVGGRNLGEGAPGGSVTVAKASLTISANVSYDASNATENNKMGITFDGISITAYVSERTVSSSSDLSPTSGGYLSVSLVDDEYAARLETPTGPYWHETGTKSTTATVNIPAYKFSSTNYLAGATVKIGRPNPKLIRNAPPTKIEWGLQTKMMFRPLK